MNTELFGWFIFIVFSMIVCNYLRQENWKLEINESDEADK